MKTAKYIFAALAAALLAASCNTKIEPMAVQKPHKFTDEYYENLRAWKATPHEVSYMYFAQWSAQNSMAIRFDGLPDSLDIASVWGGGIPPQENTKLWEQLRWAQQVQGTKIIYVAIVRLWAEDDSHDFKQALNAAEAMPQETAEQREAREEKIMEAVDMYAMYYVDQVFKAKLDGFDADYEPEGDKLTGDYFRRFVKKLAEYMGPNPDQTKEERLALIRERFGAEETDVNKILLVDTYNRAPETGIHQYLDYYVNQNYGGGTPRKWGDVPYEKSIYCVNWGDDWNKGIPERMIRQASFEPETGHKGGFGAFYGQRDYFITEKNPEPYWLFRHCIQIQNPAVVK